MTLALLIYTALIGVVFIIALRWRLQRKLKSAAVLVLGDIGHSPRMQNHAVSLANHNFYVHFIGFKGRS